MGKNAVDGVYSADPKLVKSAKKFDDLTHMEIINRGLAVMDSTAISFCMDNNLPIIVFSIDEEDNIIRVINGEKMGTSIKK